MKGNSKRTSGNSLSPLGVKYKDISAALQTLPTEVKLRLRLRLQKVKESILLTITVAKNSSSPFSVECSARNTRYACVLSGIISTSQDYK